VNRRETSAESAARFHARLDARIRRERADAAPVEPAPRRTSEQERDRRNTVLLRLDPADRAWVFAEYDRLVLRGVGPTRAADRALTALSKRGRK
jgi:hypothetical protein